MCGSGERRIARAALTAAVALLATVAVADDATSRARLLVPVVGVMPSQLRDTFHDKRGNGLHEALDIPAARGTSVVAVDDGRIVKLFHSVPGGITVYQADPQNAIVYYYAHLDRYAEGLREGQAVRRGELIGYVGSTGNAAPDAPHLHFAIMKLPPGKEWWKGTAVDPLPFFVLP